MKYNIKKEVRLNSIWVLLLAILIVTNFYSCTDRGIVLVDNGVSNYEIVTRENASKKEQYAAKELQNYLEKISTVSLSIVHENSLTENMNKVFVTKLNLHPHEIQIKTNGADIFISGGSDAAVKNAVYEFLELYLNCKWYTPNVEEIPVSKSILIAKDINYSYNPSITTRTVHSRLFYDNPVFAEKHKVTSEAFPFYVKDARVHTFHKFVPDEKYYKDHPEYFALRGNKRLPTQLCLTNENVYEIVRASVSSFFEQNPEARVISVSQNDNQQYCQCDGCSKIDEEEGGPTGTMIQFVNKIAADFPDKTISTLAYQYTRKPSKTKPLKNVLITLCSIECDRSAPIEEKCTDFAEDLKGWREISNTIRIWDYTTQFTNFLAPFPNMHTLQPNIKFFRDNNAKWIFEQHSNNPSELFELRSYVMAKLLWNPDASVEEIITEFTEGYYKEAGVYVRKYIDLIHKKIVENNDFFLFLYGDPSQAFSSYLNHELLDQYTSFFDDAEKAVSYNSEIVERVRVARLSIDYAILEAFRRGLTEKYSLIVKNEQGKVNANPIVVEKLDKFYTTCNKATITLMNEMGFTVEEYYVNYKKALEVAVKPNKAIGKKVTLNTTPKKYANEDPQTLTDGALGGNSFYANWLGFEGNHLEAVIDLDNKQSISSISTAFLQVTNHIVFFPENVTYYYSNDNKKFVKIGNVKNDKPLIKTSKVNDIKYFNINFSNIKARYIKIVGENMNEAPYWHHAAGLPSWIFADEIIIN